MAAAQQCAPITPNLPALPLPEGITSSYIHTPALTYHILSSGAPTKENPTKKPLILLLHGFPELAYSWRKVLVPLSQISRLPQVPFLDEDGEAYLRNEGDQGRGNNDPEDGYHVVAYDQRGYGRTTGWDTRGYGEVDLNGFRMTEVVKDAVRLVSALGYKEVECIVGHDFGAVGAALAGVIRPDVFKKVVLMSRPFSGIPSFPVGTNDEDAALEKATNEIETCLRNLAQLPQPRKHYKWYYSTKDANDEMAQPKQGLKNFLRGYFFLKSGDNSKQKRPEDLAGWKAEEMAKMPGYYIMPLHKTMSQTIADDLKEHSEDNVALSKQWMSDEEMDVYVSEFGRNGFQGGLNYYRVGTSRELQSDLEVFRGKTIDVPSIFIAGQDDWGVYQAPGALHEMKEACPATRGFMRATLAGHWVMQENPERVVDFIGQFLEGEDLNGPEWR